MFCQPLLISLAPLRLLNILIALHYTFFHLQGPAIHGVGEELVVFAHVENLALTEQPLPVFRS